MGRLSVLQNGMLIAALLGWLVAQGLKTLLDAVINRKFNKELLTASGGMPSSHSATVCALAMMAARSTGLGSPEFAITIVLAVVVMYDAMGVRRSSGEQAQLLNKVISHLNSSDKSAEEFQNTLNRLGTPERFDAEDDESDDELKQIKEKLGHTPLEVLAGALLGILIALLLPVS